MELILFIFYIKEWRKKWDMLPLLIWNKSRNRNWLKKIKKKAYLMINHKLLKLKLNSFKKWWETFKQSQKYFLGLKILCFKLENKNLKIKKNSEKRHKLTYVHYTILKFNQIQPYYGRWFKWQIMDLQIIF
jgi:hypothetical protein